MTSSSGHSQFTCYVKSYACKTSPECSGKEESPAPTEEPTSTPTPTPTEHPTTRYQAAYIHSHTPMDTRILAGRPHRPHRIHRPNSLPCRLRRRPLTRRHQRRYRKGAPNRAGPNDPLILIGPLHADSNMYQLLRRQRLRALQMMPQSRSMSSRQCHKVVPP